MDFTFFQSINGSILHYTVHSTAVRTFICAHVQGIFRNTLKWIITRVHVGFKGPGDLKIIPQYCWDGFSYFHRTLTQWDVWLIVTCNVDVMTELVNTCMRTNSPVSSENDITLQKYTVWRHHHLLGPSSLFLKGLCVRMRLFPSSSLCCLRCGPFDEGVQWISLRGTCITFFRDSPKDVFFYAHPGVSYLSASLRTESSGSQHKVKKKKNTTQKLHGAPLNCCEWMCGGKNSVRLRRLLSGPVES